jgi:hypothetical protein
MAEPVTPTKTKLLVYKVLNGVERLFFSFFLFQNVDSKISLISAEENHLHNSVRKAPDNSSGSNPNAINLRALGPVTPWEYRHLEIIHRVRTPPKRIEQPTVAVCHSARTCDHFTLKPHELPGKLFHGTFLYHIVWTTIGLKVSGPWLSPQNTALLEFRELLPHLNVE